MRGARNDYYSGDGRDDYYSGDGESGEANVGPRDVKLMTAMWERQATDRPLLQRASSAHDEMRGSQQDTRGSHEVHATTLPRSIPSIQSQYKAWKETQSTSNSQQHSPLTKSYHHSPPTKSHSPKYSGPVQSNPAGRQLPNSPSKPGHSSPSKSNSNQHGSPTRTNFNQHGSPAQTNFSHQQNSPSKPSKPATNQHAAPSSYGSNQFSSNQFGSGPNQYGTHVKSDAGQFGSYTKLNECHNNVDSDTGTVQYRSTASLSGGQSKEFGDTSDTAQSNITKLTIRPGSAQARFGSDNNSSALTWKPRAVQPPAADAVLSWKPQSHAAQQLVDFRKGSNIQSSEDSNKFKVEPSKVTVNTFAVSDLGSRSSSNDTLSNLVAANTNFKLLSEDDGKQKNKNEGSDKNKDESSDKRLLELIERAKETERELEKKDRSLADAFDSLSRPFSPETSSTFSKFKPEPPIDKNKTNLPSPTSAGKTSSWSGTISNFAPTRSGMPLSQNPTVTLLQKGRGMLIIYIYLVDCISCFSFNRMSNNVRLCFVFV